LHNEAKEALKDNAMVLTAQKATNEMQAALTMIENFTACIWAIQNFIVLTVRLVRAKSINPRMTEASFAWANECSKCGNGTYYFVAPLVKA